MKERDDRLVKAKVMMTAALASKDEALLAAKVKVLADVVWRKKKRRYLSLPVSAPSDFVYIVIDAFFFT